MSRLQTSLQYDQKHDDDLLYYNAIMHNTGTIPTLAAISDIRGQALLNKPEDWHMSVVRFVLASELIPLANLPIAAGGLSSTLQFTVTFGGVDYPDFVALPVTPYTATALGSLVLEGGDILSYDDLLDLFNQCLANIFIGIPGLPAGTEPPVFAY